MSKMFMYQGKRMVTWNLFTGCGEKGEGFCTYCYARNLINTRLKDTPKYKDHGFKPTIHMKEVGKKFKSNEFVFCSSLGDISFATQIVFDHFYTVFKDNPQTKFLLCTKNPAIYTELSDLPNLYFGTTLETNRDTLQFSKAPMPITRYGVMSSLKVQNKFVSIEPIMDFDLDIFTRWILDIYPKIVEVGADNYGYGLPEPSSDKIKMLIKSMEQSGIEVICKDGLHRLLK